jgi:hypothetical protein
MEDDQECYAPVTKYYPPADITGLKMHLLFDAKPALMLGGDAPKVDDFFNVKTFVCINADSGALVVATSETIAEGRDVTNVTQFAGVPKTFDMIQKGCSVNKQAFNSLVTAKCFKALSGQLLNEPPGACLKALNTIVEGNVGAGQRYPIFVSGLSGVAAQPPFMGLMPANNVTASSRGGAAAFPWMSPQVLHACVLYNLSAWMASCPQRGVVRHETRKTSDTREKEITSVVRGVITMMNQAKGQAFDFGSPVYALPCLPVDVEAKGYYAGEEVSARIAKAVFPQKLKVAYHEYSAGMDAETIMVPVTEQFINDLLGPELPYKAIEGLASARSYATEEAALRPAGHVIEFPEREREAFKARAYVGQAMSTSGPGMPVYVQLFKSPSYVC